jgi:hypothetical protein
MENIPACFGIAKCFRWVHGLLNKYQLSKLNQFSLSGLGVGIVNLHSQKMLPQYEVSKNISLCQLSMKPSSKIAFVTQENFIV